VSSREKKPAVKTAAAKSSRVKKAVKKSSAKKAARKRTVKTSAKPKSARAIKRARAAQRGAAVEKRKQTKAATNRTVGAEPIAVDPTDEAARAAIDKRQVRGRRTAVHRLKDPPPALGIALVERVTRAVERELSQIEVIVGGSHVNRAQRTEAERRARTLASLARTLTEVRKLRAEEDKLKPQHDDVPEDIDEFRRALSEKLDRLVRESQELYPEPSDGAGVS
jgi:Tfp pilus assembly major pilin PilA